MILSKDDVGVGNVLVVGVMAVGTPDIPPSIKLPPIVMREVCQP